VENNRSIQPALNTVAYDQRPLIFKEWYDRNTGFIPGQEYTLYNQYLVEWYKQQDRTTTTTKTNIKLNYLSLLRQLQVFFPSKELENWYSKINLDDEKDLLLAIPYFARKLKEIAYYYYLLRQKIKQARVKHSLVGTNYRVKEQIRELLLENFTRNIIQIPADLWLKVPALSSINKDTFIFIEELYDTFSYFDQTATLPVSTYYNVNDKNLQTFLTSRGFELSSTEWLYKLGTNVFSLSADDPILLSLNQQILNKYAGGSLFTSEIYTVSAQKDFYNLIIKKGENSFFWPSGTYVNKAKTLPQYEPIPLSSDIFLNIGTLGDTVFTSSAEGVQGAWLQLITNNVYDTEIVSKFNANTKTIFKFPFPGYGLSSEDIPWTGYSYKTDIRFNYLDDVVKRNIENLYWTTNTTLTSIDPINIQGTTLIEQGAYPSTNYSFSDKIRVKNNIGNYNSSVQTGAIQEAWLYRFNETSLPITSNHTSILWPYITFLPDNYAKIKPPFNDFNNVCIPVSLNNLNLDYAAAGNTLSSADVIYKVKKYSAGPENGIECAWLSGAPLTNPELNLIATCQSSFNCTFSAGAFTRFIWDGPNNTNVNEVFIHYKHYPNCQYLLKPNAIYTDFNLCTCRQTNLSPFGHPGVLFENYNKQADFIVEDNFTPNIFDITTWKDNSSTTYAQSSAFCWYKTQDKIGWNSGLWVNGNNNAKNNFYLKKGKSYVYYRANTREVGKFPDYITRYKYKNYPVKWIKGIKKKEDAADWVSTDTPSDMTINPGDFLVYARTSNIYYSLTGLTAANEPFAIREKTIWSNYDNITINHPTEQILISFPIENYLDNSDDPQYPEPGLLGNIRQFFWKITAPNSSTTYIQTPICSFVPTVTGLYTIALTALVNAQTGFYEDDFYYYFNNIPSITAVESLTYKPTLSTYYTKIPDFVLRVPLEGWDYNTNAFNPYVKSNTGARPFWAESKINRDGITYSTVIDTSIKNQPPFSNITLKGSEYVEYIRKFNTDLIWSQPVTVFNQVNKKQWSTLQLNFTGLAQGDLFESPQNAYVTRLTSVTPIVFNNYINNEPVEVTYTAYAPFTWSLTATPVIETPVYTSTTPTRIINPAFPWANIFNAKNSTIAFYPTIESLSSTSQLGGFFTPSYYGITKYVNKNYSYTLNVTSAALTGIFTNPNDSIAIRGLSKTEPITPFTIQEDNTWLKEPPISSSIAGTINKNIFKKYQKFIPYQSTYETNPNSSLGLILPTSRQNPWTGSKNNEWGDLQNSPTSFTGVINLSSWVNTQNLKKNDLYVDDWCTDIYGNQYGLYKTYDNSKFLNQQSSYGEIWVRNNAQRVFPGVIGLSGIFDSYLNTSFIHELTSNGIRKIDVFFDTLFLETSGIIFLEKINYNYDTQQIFSLADNARFISLTVPVTSNILREFNNENNNNIASSGQVWFSPNKKILYISVAEILNNNINPILFKYDINTQNLQKIFPVHQRDRYRINQLKTLQIIKTDRPTLSYNSIKKQFIYSTSVDTTDNETLILEIAINDDVYDTNKIKIYKPVSETLPPAITHTLQHTLTSNQTFAIQITSTPNNTTYTSINLPTWVNLTTNGLFKGISPIVTEFTTFYVPFGITNKYGTTYHNLTINVV